MPLEAAIGQLLAPYCLAQHVQGYTGSLWTPPSGNFVLRIALAATRVTGKRTTMKECTYFAGRFYGRGNVPVCYRVHRPMKGVLGFTRSHWMPSLGKSLLQY
jgi:hypothetical protein